MKKRMTKKKLYVQYDILSVKNHDVYENESGELLNDTKAKFVFEVFCAEFQESIYCLATKIKLIRLNIYLYN